MQGTPHERTNAAISGSEACGGVFITARINGVVHVAHAAVEAYFAARDSNHVEARVAYLEQQNMREHFARLFVELSARRVLFHVESPFLAALFKAA